MNDQAKKWFTTNTISSSCPLLIPIQKAKRSKGITISVCLPALNEGSTIGGICASIRSAFMGKAAVVDQLVVMDSGSSDDTVALAAAAGAEVYRARDIAAPVGPSHLPGKGEALWKSLAVLKGDIVVWLDSDTKNFAPDYVTKLVAPLLTDPGLVMTKAYYERPGSTLPGEGRAGGGRITEVAVRPWLALLHPHLTGFVQPLSGEYAFRRDAITRIPFFSGYAVEIGHLIDVSDVFGLDAIAQVELGERFHRTRDLPALGRAAAEITAALVARSDERWLANAAGLVSLTQFDLRQGWPRSETTPVSLVERPPAQDVFYSASRSTGTTEGAASTVEGRA